MLFAHTLQKIVDSVVQTVVGLQHTQNESDGDDNDSDDVDDNDDSDDVDDNDDSDVDDDDGDDDNDIQINQTQTHFFKAIKYTNITRENN